MKQEDKELLLKDLSARLPYKVIVRFHDINVNDYDRQLIGEDLDFIELDRRICKPYLCPMSSMTEEEHEELLEMVQKDWSIDINKLGDLYFDIGDACYPDIDLFLDIIDWLNKHHFDYRGLISKGIALKAPKGMYK